MTVLAFVDENFRLRYASDMVRTDPARPGLREMTRRAVRVQIADQAMALFLRDGFEETTIEQIAAEVGMSGRSVSRYFASKEDMVVGNLRVIGQAIADRLATRPRDERPWEALRSALDEHLNDLNNDQDGRLLATSVMLANTPALRAALTNKHAEWEDLLVPLVVRHLNGRPESCELQARALVAAALACLTTAVTEWTRSGGTKRVDELLDSAITAVRG